MKQQTIMPHETTWYLLRKGYNLEQIDEIRRASIQAMKEEIELYDIVLLEIDESKKGHDHIDHTL